LLPLKQYAVPHPAVAPSNITYSDRHTEDVQHDAQYSVHGVLYVRKYQVCFLRTWISTLSGAMLIREIAWLKVFYSTSPFPKAFVSALFTHL
jgi:hypothetical protein